MDRLSDREHVRKRPGMYIGDTKLKGLHHLVGEIIGNSIDQFLVDQVSRISIQIEDGVATIVDDGPGLPFDLPSNFGNDSLATDYFLKIHKTPSVDHHAPHVHFHSPIGVGVFVVAALSEYVNVESFRNGKLYSQSFSRGEATTKVAQPNSAEPFFADQNEEASRGTRFTFKPDPEIFPDHTLDAICLRGRILDAAYLYPGMIFELQKERFCTRGLADLAMTECSTPSTDCFWLDHEIDGVAIHAAARGHARNSQTLWKSWANGVRTTYGDTGGTHEDAFREALQVVGWNPEVALIHVVMQEPKYAGPTKCLLDVPEKKNGMKAAILEALSDYCEKEKLGTFKHSGKE